MGENLRQFISTLPQAADSDTADAGVALSAAGASSKPTINVSAKDTGSGGEFTVTGSGFTPSANVRIRIVDDAFAERDYDQSADSNGGLKAVLTFPCIGGLALHFSATSGVPDSGDLTGVLWSNTFTLPCPCAPPKPDQGDDNGDDNGDGSGGSGSSDDPSSSDDGTASGDGNGDAGG